MSAAHGLCTRQNNTGPWLVLTAKQHRAMFQICFWFNIADWSSSTLDKSHVATEEITNCADIHVVESAGPEWWRHSQWKQKQTHVYDVALHSTLKNSLLFSFFLQSPNWTDVFIVYVDPRKGGHNLKQSYVLVWWRHILRATTAVIISISVTKNHTVTSSTDFRMHIAITHTKKKIGDILLKHKSRQ